MIRVLGLWIAALPLLAQSTEASLTQALISEIRALRLELQATTTASQRVQIALYRLQSQTAIVTAAQQRLEAARTKLIDAQTQHRGVVSQVQNLEELLRNTNDAAERKRFQDTLPPTKALEERLAAEEGARQSTVAEAESQLRTEQTRLSDLQSLLDKLDRALDELAHPAK